MVLQFSLILSTGTEIVFGNSAKLVNRYLGSCQRQQASQCCSRTDDNEWKFWNHRAPADEDFFRSRYNGNNQSSFGVSTCCFVIINIVAINKDQKVVFILDAVFIRLLS